MQRTTSTISLKSLSISEFLSAVGRSDLISHLPRLGRPVPNTVSPAVHDLLNGYLRDYFIVGGMPAAVRAFVKGRDFIAAANVQDNLLQSFRDDIHRYASGDLQGINLEQILENGIRHVGKQIKYTTISPDVDTRRTKKSLELLEKACLLYRIKSANPSGVPLGAEANEKLFKLQFIDIGLGQRWAGFQLSELQNSSNLLDVYDGRIAEQFV